MRRAASWSNATARRARPASVRRNASSTRTISATPTTGTSSSCGYTPAPSTVTARWARLDGNARASLPKVSIATFSAMTPRAIVARSHAIDAEVRNGRTATRSTSTPSAASASSVASTEGTNGQPAPT